MKLSGILSETKLGKETGERLRDNWEILGQEKTKKGVPHSNHICIHVNLVRTAKVASVSSLFEFQLLFASLQYINFPNFI